MAHDLLRVLFLCQNDYGYYMYYHMHVLAKHPLFQRNSTYDVEPQQSADMTVSVYLQHWKHYIHMQLLHGIFISDCYHLLQLIACLAPLFCEFIGC